MEKRELRKRFLELRSAVTERQARDAAICRHLRELECCRNADALALYVSDGREPDLRDLFLWKRTFLYKTFSNYSNDLIINYLFLFFFYS